MPKMRHYPLDEIERRIIYELESDCKVSVNELGEKLGISKRMVETRMHKLIGNKAIVNFVAIVDFSKLGYVDHEVWVQVRHMQAEKKRKFLDSLISHPQVGWVASCGGKFDFAFSIMAEDSVTFSDILRKLLSDNPGIVQNYSISIATKIRSFPRTYLLQKPGIERKGALFFSGPPQKIKLDKKDIAILTILARDAKTPAVEIGRKIGMSTNAARMRVKRLETMKVIQGYKAIFQPSVIGIQNYEILITTEGITAEKEAEVDEYCRSNPHITLFMSCIGRWDINLSVDIDGPQQLQQTLSEIRDRFGPVIKDFEYTPILYVYKFNLGRSQ